MNNNRIDFSNQKYIAFKFMYIGKNYEGLVIQSHTENTVEAHIFKALARSSLIESLDKCNYSRCGRTDAGVSSTGNVFSLNVRYKEGLDYIKILNSLLPKDIRIIGAREVDDSFDARFSCLYREYKYFFLGNALNIQRMSTACKKLLGVHNFKNFCKIDKSDPNYMTKSYERRIYEFRIEKYKNENLFPSLEVYVATIRGSAFLWHQVRCMMGVLFLIGKGLEDESLIDDMLNVEGNNYKFVYEIANETPLILTDCQYEFVDFEVKLSDVADSFLNLNNFYEENLIQLAMSSYFLNTLNRIALPLVNIGEESLVEYYRKNFLRNKKYTKMLQHKTNRTQNK